MTVACRQRVTQLQCGSAQVLAKIVELARREQNLFKLNRNDRLTF